jgi:ABC-type multidrug transport system ATPase subunit
MDEASRFDWLAGMDDGQIIAHGAPKEILARAQKSTLDDAFIALLPPEKRGQHQEVIVRPRAESDDKTPAIEAEGLTRRFGDFVAVDHVSFRIGRGEIFGFLGSNGSGKTTTMKMMTGLLPVTEGSAKLFGKPMAADDMEARENVGYMSQAFSLYSELTVQQNRLTPNRHSLARTRTHAREKSLRNSGWVPRCHGWRRSDRIGQWNVERTWRSHSAMSAFGSKADITRTYGEVA